MKRILTYLSYIGVFWAAGNLSLQAAETPTVRSVLSVPLNPTQLATLAGNTHPLARARFDQGAAPQDLPMNRMLLVLKRTPEQDTALAQLLSDQQNTSSAHYHQWLTPEQFGQQFGLADQDLQKVISWLESRGFQVDRVSHGRTLIEFSGTAAAVQAGFHTAIHKFVVNGSEHWANVTDPQIPAALLPAVAGVASLHNFTAQPQAAVAAQDVVATVQAGSPRPQFGSGGSQALAPADYSTIYNIGPLYQTGINGSGTVIAVVGRTNINVQDVNSFRSTFGLPANSPQVVVNGPNPGDLGGGEEMEAVLDTTWAGAVAPKAQVDLVVSASTNSTDGIFLSEQYIIDNNLANVMTESFGDCEANYSQSSAAAISSMAQQAAAQGITFVVSAGDSGSAGCDNFNTENSATGPVSVNVLASTPYTVAVGGTQFNDNANPSQYWSSQNGTGYGSALSYVPEDVWNNNCVGNQCGSNSILAGGGGHSQFFTKPSWQSGVPGIPNDGARDLPDVALTASGHDPYLLCLGGGCTPGSSGQIRLTEVYGTSASAPSFAGIMALVNQRTGSRQGQANAVLYRLAASESFGSCNGSNTGGLPAGGCIFNDVTVGTNAVPGEPAYNTSSETYGTNAGYDLASGLGSVNATNLVNGWTGSAAAPSPSPSPAPAPAPAPSPAPPPSNGWQQVAGTLATVWVGADGATWGINGSGQVYWLNPQTGNLQLSSISLSQMAVGSSNAVWGLDSAGNIYRFNSSNQSWSQVFGNLTKIAVGYDGDVWGIGHASDVWHFNSAGQSWTSVPGALSQISVGFDGSVWGLNSSGAIYRYNPGTQNFTSAPGYLTQIAVGGDGDTWGIDGASQIWHFNSLIQNWVQIPGIATQIAVGAANSVWVLNSAGQIYKFNNGTQNWDSLPGQLAKIAVGANGAVWGVNNAGQVWGWSHYAQASQVFHVFPGQLLQMSISPEGSLWGVDRASQIWHYNPLIQYWDHLPGAAVQISVGFGANAWVVTNTGQIWRYIPANQNWTQVRGILSQVSVGSDGSVWGVDNAKQIWRYNPSIQFWDHIPGSLSQVSVGVDGTVWGVNAGAIYAFNTQSQAFYQVPGSLVQVAVGSANNVWGITPDRRTCQYLGASQWSCSGANVTSLGVGFDGAVWVTNTSNQAWTFNSQTQYWSQAAGTFNVIAVGADAAVWALDGNGITSVYR